MSDLKVGDVFRIPPNPEIYKLIRFGMDSGWQHLIGEDINKKGYGVRWDINSKVYFEKII